jgi:hypothetical protein
LRGGVDEEITGCGCGEDHTLTFSRLNPRKQKEIKPNSKVFNLFEATAKMPKIFTTSVNKTTLNTKELLSNAKK